MSGSEFNVQATVRAVGTSAVLVVALAVVYGIAKIQGMEPWLKLVLVLIPGSLIVSGAVWMLSGGEQGTHVEVRDGQRRLSIKNLNVLARTIARGAMEAFQRAPLPPPSGQIGPGSPADRASIIEGPAPLPETVEVSEKPIDLPRDAGHLP